MITQLKGGADFGKLAKSLSIDGSKENGGDLGWFSPNAMVKPFSDALMQLKKGQYTQTPVQTQFGFHVIKLDDIREASPPSFDQAKEQLAQIVQRKKLQKYSDELLAAAKIDPPLTAAAPAATDAATATEAPKP